VEEVIAEADGPLYNKRLDLHLDEAHKIAILDYFAKNPPSDIAGIKVKEIGHKDGIKLYLQDGSWVLLRPSGTEPLMRIYIETNAPEKQEPIAEIMELLIKRLEPVGV
jgi:phosphomannomutase